jgi:hypothetical protein
MLEKLAKLYVRSKIQSLQKMRKHAVELQYRQWQQLLSANKSCEYIRRFLPKQKTYSSFAQSIPVASYDDLKPFIQRMMKAEQNILCSAEVQMFSKSSGTTDASKFIPVTKEAIFKGHFLAGRHLLASYFERLPENKLFSGKNLVISGSAQKLSDNEACIAGDVSALLTLNLPAWIQRLRTPDLNTVLLPDWDKKLLAIAEKTVCENVTGMSGVPSWAMEILKKVLEIAGKEKIAEVWENFELFIHGGVNFQPYQAKFETLTGKKVKYINAYNASEGFFAFSDTADTDSLLLLPYHGIFFEFREVENLSNIVPLEGVKKHVIYELIITTNSGLWRYSLGDTIEFVSLDPYRFKLTGRTRQYINIAGEELMVYHAENALLKVCRKWHCQANEFSAAPLFFEDGTACHQWFIEFESMPHSIEKFEEELDIALQQINSDYQAKRVGNRVLKKLQIVAVSPNFFRTWLAKQKRLNAQAKVPRLHHNRKYADEYWKLFSS